MDSYKTGQHMGNRAELQLGYRALRAKELRDLLRSKDLGYEGLDDIPKWELLKICEAEVIRGTLDDIAKMHEPKSIEDLRAEMESKHAEEMAGMRAEMAEMKAMMGAKPPVVEETVAAVPAPAPFEIPPEMREGAGVSFDATAPEDMDWHPFKAYAKSQGIDTKGMKRLEIQAALDSKKAQ